MAAVTSAMESRVSSINSAEPFFPYDLVRRKNCGYSAILHAARARRVFKYLQIFNFIVIIFTSGIAA
jgi:hypothetical protein